MNNAFKILVSPTAEWTLDDAESFKAASIGAEEAAIFIDNLLLSTVEAISKDPERYRFNSMLAEKGVRFRERIDPDSGYRCIYDYDGQSVEILLFVHTKQDLESVLYRYLITR